MARSPTPLVAAALSLAALSLSALSLSACNRALSCTTEVSAASGTFRGTVWGTRSEESLRRDSLQSACGQLCVASNMIKTAGCVSQCAADIASSKVTARTSCSEKETSSP